MKQLRRTMLFVPGNNPGMIKDAGIYGQDSIMFDLEDSVSLTEKDAARFLVYQALCSMDYRGKELVVRVNDPATKCGVDDLEAIVRTQKAVIRLPKTESAEDVLYCQEIIARIERENGIAEGSTRMMAAIESAAGVLNAKEIAFSTPRLIGIALGAEDYVTDLKTKRSPGGIELLFGRSMILLAARAAGIDAIDTVYSDVNNEEGFRAEVELDSCKKPPTSTSWALTASPSSIPGRSRRSIRCTRLPRRTSTRHWLSWRPLRKHIARAPASSLSTERWWTVPSSCGRSGHWIWPKPRAYGLRR